MTARTGTNYARSNGVHIAYQVVGEGAVDLVFVPPWVSHLEALWEEPGFARMCRRLAAFSRLILIDRRGVGLSDRLPVVGAGDLEDGVVDIESVLDAVGTRHAALFSGNVGGGQICMLFAARRPERTVALVLFGTFARPVWAPDQPWAPSRAHRGQDRGDLGRVVPDADGRAEPGRRRVLRRVVGALPARGCEPRHGRGDHPGAGRRRRSRRARPHRRPDPGDPPVRRSDLGRARRAGAGRGDPRRAVPRAAG